MDKALALNRGNSMGGFRNTAMTYIVNPKNHPVGNIGTEKGDRGWNNFVTARMLCPKKFLNKFDANPEA